MTLDHIGKRLIGGWLLSGQAGAPVVEEHPRRGFVAVVPQLPKVFLEQVGGVEPPVRGQEPL